MKPLIFSISPYIDRAFDELDPIETAILRLAVYELRFELDVPYKVVINEAIEVAKVFGADESHKYINGVLDKIAPALGGVNNPFKLRMARVLMRAFSFIR